MAALIRKQKGKVAKKTTTDEEQTPFNENSKTTCISRGMKE